MNLVSMAGGALLIAGVVGYAMGTATDYPGRAFSLTVLMVGIALVAMREAFEEADE